MVFEWKDIYCDQQNVYLTIMLTKLYKKGKTVWSTSNTGLKSVTVGCEECEVSSWLYCSYAWSLGENRAAYGLGTKKRLNKKHINMNKRWPQVLQHEDQTMWHNEINWMLDVRFYNQSWFLLVIFIQVTPAKSSVDCKPQNIFSRIKCARYTSKMISFNQFWMHFWLFIS